MDDARSPTPTGTATLTPSLRWTHLAATICLSKGTAVPWGTLPTFNLITYLKQLPPAALVAACRPDQRFDTSGGLFAQVSEVPKAARCSFYGDDAGGPFKLKLRAGTFDAYISPEGVILPWPLAGDAALAQAYADAAESVPDWVPIPALSDETSNANGLFLGPVMHAADDAVAPYSPDRCAFDKARKSPGGARAWVVDHAVQDYGGNAPPASFDVEVNDAWLTTDTTWSLGSTGGLLLTLGWKPIPGVPVVDCDEPQDEIASGMIQQWPCGPYRGFGPYPCP